MLFKNIHSIQTYLRISRDTILKYIKNGKINRDATGNYSNEDIQKIYADLQERRKISPPVWIHAPDTPGGRMRYYDNDKKTYNRIAE